MTTNRANSSRVGNSEANEAVSPRYWTAATSLTPIADLADSRSTATDSIDQEKLVPAERFELSNTCF
jgi:hypothetical protein